MLAPRRKTAHRIHMARSRRKKQRFSAVKAVKAAAREHVGTPRPTQVAPASPQRKIEKHKPTLGKLLSEE
jgi:hypothetical protein